MRKSFLSLFFLLFACVCPLALHASNEAHNAWDGSTKTPAALSGGVYTVSTAAQLAWIAEQNEDFAGKTIVLQQHLDLGGYTWKPIGTAAKPFKGTFKGKGHLIKGLHSFTGTDGVGLFGHVTQGAVIDSLGISGGVVVAKNQRRIGTIAGVCGGQIAQCWSMAEIAAADNVVGGLVGELTATGSITDAYNAGLIYHANDTIGGITGRNFGGTMTRVYNTGYAKNGKAIVGVDMNGTYTDCYYDRKLYYQQSGITADQNSPIDITANLFSLYTGQAAWSQGTNRYPVLHAFETTDAALLSAAPMFIDATAINPVNHANELTEDFVLSTEGGITWTCQDESAERWIAINGSQVDVTRPCTETDVLVDATLRNEVHVVYMRPLREADLQAGTFRSSTNAVLTFCHTEDAGELMATYAIKTNASKGWLGDGDYTYFVERWKISENDTTVQDTLLYAATTDQYNTWFRTFIIATNTPGHYIIRSFVTDNCMEGWMENPSGVEYIVYDEVNAGAIQTGDLPDYCAPADAAGTTLIPVVVAETAAASGDAELEYRWICSAGNTVVGYEPNLDTSFRLSDVRGKTLTFYREVRIKGCEWHRSTGVASMYFGQDTKTDVTFTVCDADMPKIMTWIDGSQHTFYNDGETWTVSDTRDHCAKDTTFIISVASVPAFSFPEDSVSWCQTTGTMTLLFNDDPTAPSNVFYIRYSNDLQTYMGKPDTTGTINTPGLIFFDNVPSLGEGDLYMTVQIGYASSAGEGSCFSSEHRLYLKPSLGGYLYSKYDRVVFVDNNPENGALPGVSNKLEFVSYQWYKNGVKLENETGQYYHEGGAPLSGVFFCMLTDTQGKQHRTCELILPTESASNAAPQTAVYPVPANAGEPVTIECSGAVRIISFAGECVTSAEHIEGQITLSAPHLPGMYYVQITAEDGTTNIHKLIVK